MAVLSFRPCVLEYKMVSGGSVDDNGDRITGTEEWIKVCDCDVVPAGQSNVITLPDGTMQTYGFTISNIPTNVRDFSLGEDIRITYGGLQHELYVKGFHRYQLQCKIWA